MYLLFLIFFIGCSTSKMDSSSNIEDRSEEFSYQDPSGVFRLTREIKKNQNKVVLRQQVLNKDLSKNDFLEKSIVVFEQGRSKKNKNIMIRPLDSHYIVWLEGQKLESRGRLDKQSKKYTFKLDSHEEKWRGLRSVNLPRGSIFCFFTIIPECLKTAGVFLKIVNNPNKAQSFYIIWEGYPFILEQFSNFNSQGISRANVSYEEFKDNTHRFVVEFDGQSIFYHLKKDLNFIRMFWISQGLSIMPINESEE
jgi:hypothetical protein